MVIVRVPGEPLMKLPFWVMSTSTSIEVAGAGVALTVKVASVPSVTLEEFRVIVTTGVTTDPPTTAVNALSKSHPLPFKLTRTFTFSR